MKNKISIFTALASSALMLTALSFSNLSTAYPVDAENTGIKRLVGSNPATEAKRARKLPPGALLSDWDIKLNLLGTEGVEWDFDGNEADPVLQAALDKMFKNRSKSYGLMIADITDPQNIAWAGIREDRSQIPGSVGKIITMLGFFSELKKAFPNIDDRERILSTHMVTAGDWVLWDHHGIPTYNPETNTVRSIKIKPGQTYALAEWIDFAISNSANAASAMMWKETVLLRHYGADYPPSPDCLLYTSPSPRDRG